MATASPIAQFRQRWQQLDASQRRLLSIALLLLILLILWTTWRWAERETTRLARALPATQAQLKAMQEDAAELDRLRIQNPPAPADALSWTTNLSSSARIRGLTLELLPDPGGIQVSGKNQNFDALIEWLADAHKTLGLQPTKLDLLREDQGIRIDARLAAAR